MCDRQRRIYAVSPSVVFDSSAFYLFLWILNYSIDVGSIWQNSVLLTQWFIYRRNIKSPRTHSFCTSVLVFIEEFEHRIVSPRCRDFAEFLYTFNFIECAWMQTKYPFDEYVHSAKINIAAEFGFTNIVINFDFDAIFTVKMRTSQYSGIAWISTRYHGGSFEF